VQVVTQGWQWGIILNDSHNNFCSK